MKIGSFAPLECITAGINFILQRTPQDFRIHQYNMPVRGQNYVMMVAMATITNFGYIKRNHIFINNFVMDEYFFMKLGGRIDQLQIFIDMHWLLRKVNMVVAMVTKFIEKLPFFTNGLNIVSYQYKKTTPGTEIRFILERYTLWHYIVVISQDVTHVCGCHGNRILLICKSQKYEKYPILEFYHSLQEVQTTYLSIMGGIINSQLPLSHFHHLTLI